MFVTHEPPIALTPAQRHYPPPRSLVCCIVCYSRESRWTVRVVFRIEISVVVLDGSIDRLALFVLITPS